MSNSPNTRKFSAWINLQPGADPKLFVVGEVETSAAYLMPKLEYVEPQGTVPQQLILNLIIENTGNIGTENVDYRSVRYERPATRGQYTSVSILWESRPFLTLDVGEAH